MTGIPLPGCRPSSTSSEVEEIIQREAKSGKGVDPDKHPMRNFWHCATHRTWHRAPMPEE